MSMHSAIIENYLVLKQMRLWLELHKTRILNVLIVTERSQVADLVPISTNASEEDPENSFLFTPHPNIIFE